MPFDFLATVVCPKCSTRQDTTLSYDGEKTPPTFPNPCTGCGATFDQTDPKTSPLCADCTKQPAVNLHFQIAERRRPGETATYVFLCITCHRNRHAEIKNFRPPRHFRPIRGTSSYVPTPEQRP